MGYSRSWLVIIFSIYMYNVIYLRAWNPGWIQFPSAPRTCRFLGTESMGYSRGWRIFCTCMCMINIYTVWIVPKLWLNSISKCISLVLGSFSELSPWDIPAVSWLVLGVIFCLTHSIDWTPKSWLNSISACGWAGGLYNYHNIMYVSCSVLISPRNMHERKKSGQLFALCSTYFC